jgi:tRNA G10  N-methylase Trm11
MAATAERLVADEFKSDAERKKRLGQYFTGARLARLLAALAGAHTAKSVIDPMVGTGDMLLGCLEHGAEPAVFGAVEIDPIAQATCERRLSEAGADHADVLLGNAFSAETIRRLPSTVWDVCITNPPYVRYQSVSRGAGGEMRLPSALEIRQGLRESIDELDALDDEDKRFFRKLAEGYSGLSDLAVPSWILCAGLVKVGGTLAIIVPTTWLNRDYAHPVQYLLTRWFDTRYVVEDADAAWFEDALIRTTLVVATRVERRPSAFAPQAKSGHLHLKLGRALADQRSVVGAAYPDDEDPDLSFAGDAAHWHAERQVPKRAPATGHWVRAAHDASRLLHAAKGDDWLRTVEPLDDDAASADSGPTVPAPLAAVVGKHGSDALVTLDELGWRVGQGLRTGANDFFYVETAGGEDGASVRVSSTLGGGLVHAAADVLWAVLRRQADLPEAFAICAEELSGRVLVLDAYALPEDIAGCGDGHYRELPKALAEHVRRSGEVNVGTPDEPKLIPNLSAVAPNVRLPNPKRLELPPRFWYQLPAFTSRHRPSLALARVNHTHPKTYLNEGRASIVDANFSSLWPVEGALVDESALLAVMNSIWALAALELAGTVLGGGALKVEAAHLRRLSFPKARPATWKKLSALGRRLASARSGAMLPMLSDIDALVVGELVGEERRDEAVRRIRNLATERLAARSG